MTDGETFVSALKGESVRSSATVCLPGCAHMRAHEGVKVAALACDDLVVAMQSIVRR